jgi:type II secretory pathway component PulM
MLFCDRPEELKKQFPGGVIVIHSPDPDRVRAVLAGAAAARSVLLVGDRVHVFVDNAKRRIEELRTRLDAAKAPYDSIEQVVPSIEDLFVSAVEGEPVAESPARAS